MTAASLDLVVIGAGPAGLAVSVAAKEAGLRHVVLERGSVAETISRFPENMTFFSTPENLEIGGIPFITGGEKPTKRQALLYYRRVVTALRLPVRTHTRVVGVSGAAPRFLLATVDLSGREERIEARTIVAATGAHDRERKLGVPGEELPHVFYAYDSPWRAFDRPVLVVGGRNTAVQAALDLLRAGARVTISYRREQFTNSVKYWLRPDIENRIREGSIAAHMPSTVVAIRPGRTTLAGADGRPVEVDADFVHLCLGWSADWSFLTRMGVELEENGCPVHDPSTRETNVPGLYLAGRVCAGEEANRIFIENGREHGAQIVGRISGAGGA